MNGNIVEAHGSSLTPANLQIFEIHLFFRFWMNIKFKCWILLQKLNNCQLINSKTWCLILDTWSLYHYVLCQSIKITPHDSFTHCCCLFHLFVCALPECVVDSFVHSPSIIQLLRESRDLFTHGFGRVFISIFFFLLSTFAPLLWPRFSFSLFALFEEKSEIHFNKSKSFQQTMMSEIVEWLNDSGDRIGLIVVKLPLVKFETIMMD